MPVTPLFAAIFALAYVYLSFVVIKHRIASNISLGLENPDTGKSKTLETAVRTHANFIEYVPLALLLLWFLEVVTFSHSATFWLGSVLLIARVLHVIGMNQPKKYFRLRQCGMLLTFSVIIYSAITLIWWYLPVSF